jgi:Zn-dependent protease with chaperone function
MDFFGAQVRARRNSFWLASGLILTILAISIFFYSFRYLFSIDREITGAMFFVGACSLFFSATRLADFVTICSASVFILLMAKAMPTAEYWDIRVLGHIALVVTGIIALGSIYKIILIAWAGVAVIVRDLGARQVLRDTQEIAERRLLNVVDEMSIAAGIIPPRVFILDAGGINAFAAGLKDSDNTIVITRGALEILSRDELQAMVAHEMSHIVNGDTRFNLKLVGFLHGVTMLYYPVRLFSEVFADIFENEGTLFFVMTACVLGVVGVSGLKIFIVVVLFGLAVSLPIYIPGSIGSFFARLTKAAISREREFLADAAAVQYTRNPDALASALLKIEQFGSQIPGPGAAVVSHMFFSNCERDLPDFFERWFVTHPVIKKRLDRLSAQQSSSSPRSAPADKPAPAEAAPSPLAHAQTLIAALPPSLLAAIATPAGAKAAIYALFLSPRKDIRQNQLAAIREAHSDALAEASLNRAQWLAAYNHCYRFSLLDLALPVLREMALEDRQRFLQCVDALASADGRLAGSEFALKHILRRTLAPAPARLRLRPERLDADMASLLALFVYAGERNEAPSAPPANTPETFRP